MAKSFLTVARPVGGRLSRVHGWRGVWRARCRFRRMTLMPIITGTYGIRKPKRRGPVRCWSSSRRGTAGIRSICSGAGHGGGDYFEHVRLRIWPAAVAGNFAEDFSCHAAASVRRLRGPARCVFRISTRGSDRRDRRFSHPAGSICVPGLVFQSPRGDSLRNRVLRAGGPSRPGDSGSS